MNWTPFLTYAAFLIVIHHTAYFVIELWSMENVGYLILKIIASTITTLLLIISYVMLFTKQQSR
jgi:hypothetical protein